MKDEALLKKVVLAFINSSKIVLEMPTQEGAFGDYKKGEEAGFIDSSIMWLGFVHDILEKCEINSLGFSDNEKKYVDLYMSIMGEIKHNNRFATREALLDPGFRSRSKKVFNLKDEDIDAFIKGDIG